MKWVQYEQMSVAPVKEARIEKVLRDQTSRLFKAMNGNGYARCDYRMAADGTIYMLEINPNCGIFYSPEEPGSADFSLIHDPVWNHHKFLKLILRSAQKRQMNLLAAREMKRQPGGDEPGGGACAELRPVGLAVTSSAGACWPRASCGA